VRGRTSRAAWSLCRGAACCAPTTAAVVILFLHAFPLLAQSEPVKVQLAPTEVTVGDHIQATLSFRVRTADLADEPRFPVWGKTWGEAEIVEAKPPAKVSEQGGIAVYEQRLVLAAFKPGQVPLPPVTIALPTKAATTPMKTPAGLALAVRSVIPQNEKDPKPKPPAEPRPLPLGDRFWWTVASLSAACLLAAWLLFRQRRAAADPLVVAPPLAPFEELTVELDRLRSEPSVITLHTGLSLALRRYLGRRLPFPALESTTSEIQRQLLARRMPGPLVRQAVELLRACDLVKFARQEVAGSRARERADETLRIGQEFESHLAPREPEVLEAAG
jgi:hypothetical protein